MAQRTDLDVMINRLFYATICGLVSWGVVQGGRVIDQLNDVNVKVAVLIQKNEMSREHEQSQDEKIRENERDIRKLEGKYAQQNGR